jgi:hypothetical protein
VSEPQEFTMMCGVAVDGLAHGAIQQHLVGCGQCRRKSAELAGGRLSVFPPQSKVPVGLTSRFLLRARTEGIPLRIPAETTRIPFRAKLAFPALAVILVALSVTHRNRQPEFRKAERLIPQVPASLAGGSESPAPRLKPVAAKARQSRITLSAGSQPSLVRVADGLFFRQASQRPVAFLAGYDRAVSRYRPSLLLASATSDGAFPEAGGFSFQTRAAESRNQAEPHIDWQRMRLPQLLSVTERAESQ